MTDFNKMAVINPKLKILFKGHWESKLIMGKKFEASRWRSELAENIASPPRFVIL